ncbi:hypothetical protein ACIO2V_17515 [Streptomyces sp. NPDC087534]
MRVAVAATALFAAAVSAPQAVAVDTPSVRVSSEADAATKALVRTDPKAAAEAVAAANVCGSSYSLRSATPLPLGTDPNMRLAMLFAYEGSAGGCAILDNNVGASRYMYVQVCKVGGTACDTDSGNFSQYAGPVYISSFACAPVTAKMGTSSSSLSINYKSSYVFPCG